jgi:tripeptide aminopeptidase
VENQVMSDSLLSRFLRYVQVDTQSDESSKTFPSTPGQLVLLEMLKQELSELGAADVQMTRHGYVMASIPANTRKRRVPTVAFLAHVDTAPDCSGKNVKPIVHRKYDGRVMKFPDKPGLTLDPATSPELRTAMGKDIVTASGTTLLGSDDKSGVAVIMTLVERLLRETKRKHGLIRVCFTPDEEIGRGVDKLDLRMLGAHVAYTLDGGPPGEICPPRQVNFIRKSERFGDLPSAGCNNQRPALKPGFNGRNNRFYSSSSSGLKHGVFFVRARAIGEKELPAQV